MVVISAPAAGAERNRPEADWARLQDVLRENRQQSGDAAEQYDEKIKRDDAEQSLIVLDEGEARQCRRERRRLALLRSGPHTDESHERDRGHEENHAERRDQGRADRIEEPAERRRADHRHLIGRRPAGDGAREEL